MTTRKKITYETPPIKIPVRYFKDLGYCDRSNLVKVNRGERRLNIKEAMALEDLDPRFPVRETRPDLIPLAPYLCPLFGQFKLCHGRTPCLNQGKAEANSTDQKG